MSVEMCQGRAVAHQRNQTPHDLSYGPHNFFVVVGAAVVASSDSPIRVPAMAGWMIKMKKARCNQHTEERKIGSS